MADETLDEAVDDIAPPPTRRRVSGKKIALLIVLPLLLLGGGGAALYLTGAIDLLLGSSHAEAAPSDEEVPEPVAEPGVFYDLPDITVSLNSDERRQHYMQIQVSLELSSEEDIAAVERVMPRIMNNFQVYLRELRLDDLRGSAGLYRLREELQRRIADASRPAEIRDVLFREMLVQ